MLILADVGNVVGATRERLTRWIEIAAGTIMIVLGLRLAEDICREFAAKVMP